MKRKILLLWEGIRIALGSLRKHVLRTTLTMLGIAMGIFAITGIFTFVNSLQYSITENLSKLGNTILFVHNWPWKDNSSDWYKYMGRPKVSYGDFMALDRSLKDVEGVSFEATMPGQTIKYKDRSVEGVEVKAVTLNYGRINSLEIEEGRYFSDIEMDAGRPVAIVGLNVAEELFGIGNHEGKEIRFSGKKVKVIGVLKSVGSGLFGTSMDDRIFIPYPLGARAFKLENRGYDKLITIRAWEYEDVPEIEAEITGIMRSTRGLSPKADNNFAINKQEMLMNQVDDFFKYLRIGGFLIAILAVVVGGFGIGNIMYASVKERTFEIGLQKSLGATREFILFQFLFEAILLCLIAGGFGILLLFGLATAGQAILDSQELGLTVVLSGSNIFWGLVISGVIGLVSGFFPALFASRLDPVESMRAA